jgi:DNA-3-methyladenine glycosylase
MNRLPRHFFGRSATTVARDLLGQHLVHRLGDQLLIGMIVETEAYCDSTDPDLACHGARNGGRPTPRSAVLFGPPGQSYLYLTYGMHWMCNVVTGQPGQANGVLIRALEPLAGHALMQALRPGHTGCALCNGPAKLCQAFGLDKRHHDLPLHHPDSPLWIASADSVPDHRVRTGPRIGLGKTPEPWLSIPWRFLIADHPCVSR